MNARSDDDQRDEHNWTEAAIEAELETGYREHTEGAAKAHIVVRLARMTLGTIVCLAGLVAMIGPGPGLLLLALGLTILARDVAWADRLLQKIQDRIPTDSDGRIPRSTLVTMAFVTAAAVAGSVWWFLLR
ncbi:MAG: PGPGW domain-containing protein [Acidimicrobiales bacterium]|nr:hypothetical protein [Acidimicrobiales bacterium]